MNNVLEQVYKIQEENFGNFNLQIQQQIFKLLDEIYPTMPLIPGVLNEPYQRKPVNYYTDSDANIKYKEYKERGQKYKRLHVACTGWNSGTEIKSYPIYSDTDKIGACAGNKERGNKIAFIVIDIDDINDFKKNGYGTLDVASWKPTLTYLTGNGLQLHYLVNINEVQLKGKSFLDKGLGIEIIANGKYTCMPGSIHPLTHTIYTILNGFYSSYLPTAKLEIAEAPEVIMNLLTKDNYIAEINSTYDIKNDSICSASEFLFKPEPIVPVNQKEFIDIENINDVVNPEKPNKNEIEKLFNNNMLSIDASENILKYYPTIELKQYNLNFQPSRIKDVKPDIINIKKATVPESENPFAKPNKINVNSTQPTSSDSEINNKINNLPDNIKNLILNPPNENRSKENEKVLIYLTSHDWSDSDIKKVFDSYPIGDKYRSKSNPDRYFEISLYNAKGYVEKEKKKHSFNQQEDFIGKYGRMTIKTLRHKTTNPDYILDKKIAKTENVLITGGSGTLKTTIVLQMAIDLLDTNCKYCLGYYPIVDVNRPKKILYINGENSGDQLHLKLDRLLSVYDPVTADSIVDNIIILTKDDMEEFYDDFDNLVFMNYIELTIIEENIDMVIVDNFSCFNSNGKEENSSSLMRPKLNKLSRIKSIYKIPVVLVHHSAKTNPTRENAIRGAAAFGNWTTYCIWIKKSNSKINNKINNEDYAIEELKNRNEVLEEEVKFKYLSQKIFPVNGPATSISSSTNTNENQLTSEKILIEVMKENNGIYNNQQSLKIALSIKFKSYNWNKHSSQYCKEIIDSAVNRNILLTKEGPCNSTVYSLNPTI